MLCNFNVYKRKQFDSASMAIWGRIFILLLLYYFNLCSSVNECNEFGLVHGYSWKSAVLFLAVGMDVCMDGCVSIGQPVHTWLLYLYIYLDAHACLGVSFCVCLCSERGNVENQQQTQYKLS